ncbi:MAG: XRE family transcriptional regulator [Bacteroidaceae bacterium]|nr:XRE family transcriptional regulator [Bacteroidaceae bacterium]
MNSCNKADILKRIQEFREYTGMAKSTLAESIGIEQTTLNNQFLGKRSLSLDVIVALLSSFSELSAEWLLRDRGDMLISKFGETVEGVSLRYNERIEKLISTIESLQGIIDENSKVMKAYKEYIKNLENELEAIKNERKIG